VLTKKEREDLIRLAPYPEGSAGSTMNTDFLSYSEQLLIQEVLKRIRLESAQEETIYHIYILDNGRKQIGTLSATDLILADPTAKRSEVMKTKAINISAKESQEEVVFKKARFDPVPLPVAGEYNNLLGNMAHDDALDNIKEKRTSKIKRFMAIVDEQHNSTYQRTSL